MPVEARIRVHHEGCLSERTYGAKTISQLGAEGHCSLFLVTGNTEEELEEFLGGFAKRLSGYSLMSRSPKVALVRGGCPPGGVEECILSYGCSIVFPSLFAEGRETHRLIAPSRERLKQLLDRLREFGPGGATLESVTEVSPENLQVSLNLADLAGQLTKKQLEVLTTAVSAGYYASPRQTTTERLAEAYGLSRTTLEEHLRKAEAKVLRSVMGVLGNHPAIAAVAREGGGRFRARRPVVAGH